MQPFPPTIIWRHKRENLKKCSLHGMESRPDFRFFKYPGTLPSLDDYIFLTIDAPTLGKEDQHRGLFILDATWRYAEVMGRQINASNLVFRSIPSIYKTAYPRRQDDCVDPDRGLSSIEAIYLSYLLLNRNVEGLLDQYYWKDTFLKVNDLNSLKLG